MAQNGFLQDPTKRFLREADIIGRREITPEQAKANAAAGRRGRRPRKAIRGRLNISSPTLWRWVKEGNFPSPVKLGPGITAWPEDAIDAWAASKGA